MRLPIFQSNSREMSLMQTQWSSIIEPFLTNPVNDGNLIQVSVVSGVNVINHKLGRKPQGWIIVDIDSAQTLYRSQPFNSLTLTLTSSGAASVGLYVF